MNPPSRLILRGITLFAAAAGFLPSPSRAGTGVENTFDGTGALPVFTSGSGNAAFGFAALNKDTTGSFNTATGVNALRVSAGSNFNTADGASTLFSNTTGAQNTASGYGALYFNISGYQNAANGVEALFHNSSGYQNTANGVEALFNNTSDAQNTAIGYQALYSDTTQTYGSPNENTAIGYQSLYSDTSGGENTATGAGALFHNTYGAQNTASGLDALEFNTGGNDNTAMGQQALEYNSTGSSNTAVGYFALGENYADCNNIGIGVYAGYMVEGGSNCIFIGNPGSPPDNATIRIGTSGTQTATYIAGIVSSTVTSGEEVIIDPSTGQLGAIASSRRFKDDIQDMRAASEALLSLRPVTFHYKPALDPKSAPQFGLVAEEVEKINPALVVHDAQGMPYSVRYEAVNAMLLNEFLKEHEKVSKLEAMVAQQQREFAAEIKALTAGLKEQASLLQKVSLQAEVAKTATRIAGD